MGRRRRWDGELVTVEHNKETLNARVLYDFFLSFGTAYRIEINMVSIPETKQTP